MNDFDWSGPAVVIRAYGSIAVHENPYGDVVVRQERDALEDDDQWVVIPVQDAELVAQAIIDKANAIKAKANGERPAESEHARLALPAPAAKTPGPRQRELLPGGVA
jgi:hypothetical protein